MTALDRALATTAPARARLERVYGRVPAVVAFLQRGDGPVTIHRCLRLVGTVERLYRESDEEIAVRAVVPGGQALEHWWRRRAESGDDLVTIARRFGDIQGIAYLTNDGDTRAARVLAVRMLDPFLADFERLYVNGAKQREIAEICGRNEWYVRKIVERMRALGFELPYRRVFVEKGSRYRFRPALEPKPIDVIEAASDDDFGVVMGDV